MSKTNIKVEVNLMEPLKMEYYKHHLNIGTITINDSTYTLLKPKDKNGFWTPFTCARDCGDHYIIAKFDRYDRIDKVSFKYTADVKDE